MWKLLIFCSLVSSNLVIASHKSAKIMGGSLIDIVKENAIFIAVLLIEEENLCGASIVTTSHLITAAHCTKGRNTKDLLILAGTNRVNKADDIFEVEKIKNHPKFNKKGHVEYDVAVIKIHSRFKFGKRINLINLPDESFEINDGDEVRVLGYGVTQNKKERPGYLRQVRIEIINLHYCKSQYNAEGMLVGDDKICAGSLSGGKDSCYGDSGGPLEKNGTLIGVVSFGAGCGDSKYPGVYSSIISVLPWIKENLK